MKLSCYLIYRIDNFFPPIGTVAERKADLFDYSTSSRPNQERQECNGNYCQHRVLSQASWLWFMTVNNHAARGSIQFQAAAHCGASKTTLASREERVFELEPRTLFTTPNTAPSFLRAFDLSRWELRYSQRQRCRLPFALLSLSSPFFLPSVQA